MSFLKIIYKQKITILLLIISIQSCSPTKYVPSNKHIVDKVKIETDDNDINTSKLKRIVRPEPLKKIAGIFAFRARLYNMLDPSKYEKRKNKREKKLERKNNRRDDRFDKKTNRLRKKMNRYFNKKERLKKQGDSADFLEAKKKYLELEKQYKYRIKHAKELKKDNHKQNVFTIAGFIERNAQQPKLLDTVLLNNTKKQYKVYLRNKGYFKPDINIKIDTFRKKRVKVKFDIKTGPPLIISEIVYNFPDSTKKIKNILEQNSKIKIKPGNKIDVDGLEKFRTDLSDLYRNNGYYYFSKQFISFKIDTTNGKYDKAKLIINFNKKVDINKVYKPWYIKKISFFNDYKPNLALQDSSYFNNIDSSEYFSDEGYNYNVYVKDKIVIKPKFIVKQIYLYPDSLYRLNSTKTTYTHLSKFKIYKLTNIQFSQSEDTNKNYINCNIKLSPTKKTDLVFEIEATNNSLNIGGATNATFTHKNLFHGGEILDIMGEISLERQKTLDTTLSAILFNTQEYTFDLKLTIPRLLTPFKSSNFIKRNNPRTVISTLFSYQNRPEYNRLQTLLRVDYYLKSSVFSNHIITLLRISSINADLSDEFNDWVQRAMLQESYEDHFIIGSNYSYIYSNQGTKGNNIFFQANFGLSGNILYAIMKASNADTTDYMYKIPYLETQFAQFAKTDFDFRYLIKKNEQQFVTRLFFGIGLPYGNSKLLPFGEKFFVGGANSIRAWQARTLGPGQYVQPEDFIYINQTGDIKIEMNLEYRFKIISYFEGALFLDVGNIWVINSYDTRIGGIFYANKFYKQLAYGTGFGLRLNLGYFVFRTDFGLKLVDPAADEGSRIIPFNRNYNWEDIVVNIAIGYPF